MHRSLTTHLWEGSGVSSIHQSVMGIRVFTIDNMINRKGEEDTNSVAETDERMSGVETDKRSRNG